MLVIGVIGMLVPVSVAHSDDKSVGCGTALFADLSSAREANDNSVASVPIINQIVPHTDYVAECESALSSRRTWTIPLAVIGAVAVGGALLVRGSAPADRPI